MYGNSDQVTRVARPGPGVTARPIQEFMAPPLKQYLGPGRAATPSGQAGSREFDFRANLNVNALGKDEFSFR